MKNVFHIILYSVVAAVLISCGDAIHQQSSMPSEGLKVDLFGVGFSAGKELTTGTTDTTTTSISGTETTSTTSTATTTTTDSTTSSALAVVRVSISSLPCAGRVFVGALDPLKMMPVGGCEALVNSGAAGCEFSVPGGSYVVGAFQDCDGSYPAGTEFLSSSIQPSEKDYFGMYGVQTIQELGPGTTPPTVSLVSGAVVVIALELNLSFSQLGQQTPQLIGTGHATIQASLADIGPLAQDSFVFAGAWPISECPPSGQNPVAFSSTILKQGESLTLWKPELRGIPDGQYCVGIGFMALNLDGSIPPPGTPPEWWGMTDLVSPIIISPDINTVVIDYPILLSKLNGGQVGSQSVCTGEYVVTDIQPAGEVFPVSDTMGNYDGSRDLFNTTPYIGMNRNGESTIIVHHRYPDGDWVFEEGESLLLARTFDSQGNGGQNLTIDDMFIPGPSATGYFPLFQMNQGGDSVIAWVDFRTPANDIAFNHLKVRKHFGPIGDNISVTDTITCSGDNAYPRSVGIDDTGSFSVLYHCSMSGGDRLYLQRYNSDGARLGEPQGVGEGHVGILSMNSVGSYVIGYPIGFNPDNPALRNWVFQRYRQDGGQWGSPLSLSLPHVNMRLPIVLNDVGDIAIGIGISQGNRGGIMVFDLNNTILLGEGWGFVDNYSQRMAANCRPIWLGNDQLVMVCHFINRDPNFLRVSLALFTREGEQDGPAIEVANQLLPPSYLNAYTRPNSVVAANLEAGKLVVAWNKDVKTPLSDVKYETQVYARIFNIIGGECRLPPPDLVIKEIRTDTLSTHLATMVTVKYANIGAGPVPGDFVDLTIKAPLDGGRNGELVLSTPISVNGMQPGEIREAIFGIAGEQIVSGQGFTFTIDSTDLVQEINEANNTEIY